MYIYTGLMNLRGSDIDFNPVFFAYVIITLYDVFLMVDSSKLPKTIEEHFKDNNIRVKIKNYKYMTCEMTNAVNIKG